VHKIRCRQYHTVIPSYTTLAAKAYVTLSTHTDRCVQRQMEKRRLCNCSNVTAVQWTDMQNLHRYNREVITILQTLKNISVEILTASTRGSFRGENTCYTHTWLPIFLFTVDSDFCSALKNDICRNSLHNKYKQ